LARQKSVLLPFATRGVEVLIPFPGSRLGPEQLTLQQQLTLQRQRQQPMVRLTEFYFITRGPLPSAWQSLSGRT
jgi:hypothetical protein